MQSLETPLGNEYLNATLFPSLPSPSDMPRSLDPESQRDSLPPLPSFNSQPDLGVNGARSKTPSGLKRMSSGPGLMPNRTASLPSTPTTAKKRPNIIGAASSHGRLFKVLADLFLLAGRHADSQIWCVACTGHGRQLRLVGYALNQVYRSHCSLQGIFTGHGMACICFGRPSHHPCRRSMVRRERDGRLGLVRDS